jgi:2-phosphosulfolactate phosphatase
MNVHHATLDSCHNVTGTVVVIDVIRAFTTAPFAFAAGASQIVPVSGVAEALSLREQFPDALIMGEVGGFPPDGFDLGNSPAALIGQDLRGRTLIQRTGAGTQGLVRALKAETLLAASFVNAGATIRYIQRQNPAEVTLVATDPRGEDRVCADYLQAMLEGGMKVDAAAFLEKVQVLGEQLLTMWGNSGYITQAQLAGFGADLTCCTMLDRFDFALVVTRQDGLLVMKQES